MGRPRIVETEEIVAAYLQTGSVWKAAKILGVVGQSVHERLVAIGHPLNGQKWTDEEVSELRSLLAEVPLGEAARRLGRSFAGAACKASELGIKAPPRGTVKIPRGVGLDKASTRRHFTALLVYPNGPTRYARSQGYDVEIFVQALQRHCPVEWAEYVATHSPLPTKTCSYCEREFIPNSGKQKYCTRQCGSTSRADASYFGGNRRQTLGLAERTCQLCGRRDVKGLSSHHIYGKENDPENMALIAICQGCHKIVTMLATRTFVDDPAGWESLISLTYMRKHGARLAVADPCGVLHVTVDIEEYDDEE